MIAQAPQAKANLLTAIRTAPAFNGVTVMGYPPTDQTWTAQMVYVDSTEFSMATRKMGAMPGEAFTIQVRILVTLTTGPDAVEDRCWQLVNAVVDLVNDKSAAFGPCVNAQDEIIGGTVEPAPAGPNGEWQAYASLRIPGQFFN